MSRLLVVLSLDCLLAQPPGTQKWAPQVGTLKNKGTTDSSPCLSPDGRLVVPADEFRKINIFRYPSGPGSAACRSAAAHASHVGCVRFTADGKHLVSVGGPDLAVLVWKVS